MDTAKDELSESNREVRISSDIEGTKSVHLRVS
ncbi:hypothetical protein LCGC14_1700250, partial [marine sediment metagenome]